MNPEIRKMLRESAKEKAIGFHTLPMACQMR